ncbi:hypothetical protein TVNIR_0507 [Thioalkalivibrio nitratireducens DSM 14787]|uniref:Uncharacterized protein n=1 Tax=Thioalkalivibrio nitratireducens (strain DSM 14787 / UNIQEM 213 / ALEN2) TaxID=1255043 RepID=L0DRJ3_THIND|nr:hypothetical protein TVNIR_0507 [Thioalkalivibrio nitratireducens DSM 14787]
MPDPTTDRELLRALRDSASRIPCRRRPRTEPQRAQLRRDSKALEPYCRHAAGTRI